MEAKPRDVRIFQSVAGDAPFSSWLARLPDGKARARIRVRIDRLALGNFGDCRSVGAGVFELRIDWGLGYRVYFAVEGPSIVLLLCGGDKSTQSQDIAEAKSYWEDYKAR